MHDVYKFKCTVYAMPSFSNVNIFCNILMIILYRKQKCIIFIARLTLISTFTKSGISPFSCFISNLILISAFLQVID